MAAAIAWSQRFLTYTKDQNTADRAGKVGQQGQGRKGRADTSCRVQQSDGVLDARADCGGAEKGFYSEQQFVSWLIYRHLYSGPFRHHRGLGRS